MLLETPGSVTDTKRAKIFRQIAWFNEGTVLRIALLQGNACNADGMRWRHLPVKRLVLNYNSCLLFVQRQFNQNIFNTDVYKSINTLFCTETTLFATVNKHIATDRRRQMLRR